jgi:hypothetical protein
MGGSVRVGAWDLGGLHFTGTETMPARKPIVLSRTRRHRWLRFIADRFRGEERP